MDSPMMEFHHGAVPHQEPDCWRNVPSRIYEFDHPERFVVGTVGEPGDRTFFLQASAGGQVVSVALEKGQVAALAEGVSSLLREAGRFPADSTAIADRAPLDAPIVEEFRVGNMSVAWTGERVIIEASADDVDVLETDDDELLTDPVIQAGGPSGMLRVSLAPEAAEAFVHRAEVVVAAGRKPCIWCGRPLDPTGHVCPRMN